ncbi:MAG TPA: MASE1 domain-containing protein [Blastocatellia bacterium]|nr:MASE1 domain-containing protein [Blastocatellia bacterium]
MKPRQIPYPLLLLIVAAAYFGAAEVGLSQAFLHTNVSPVWPPTGVAIAAVWLLGHRISPAILLGAFLANLATAVPLATAGGIAVGNTVEAVLAVFLLHRFVGLRSPFYRAQDAVIFVIIAGAFSTAVSATIGNISLCLGGAAAWDDFAQLWLTWWFGDGVGAIVVAPLLLTWVEESRERWPLRRAAEAALLVVSLSVGAFIVLGGVSTSRVVSYFLWSLIYALLLWAAFRFGPRGVATTIALFSGIAVWATRRGFGPFVGDSPNESLLLLQICVAAFAITFLLLAAIVVERKRAEETARAKESELEKIINSTPFMLTRCSRDLQYRFVSRAYAEMIGRTPEEVEGKPIVEILGEEGMKTVSPYIEQVLRGHRVEYETEVHFSGVGAPYLHVVYTPDRDVEGNVTGWFASIIDITDRKSAEDRFRVAVEAAPNSVVMIGEEGRIILVNSQTERLFGYARQELIGQPIEVLVPERFRRQHPDYRAGFASMPQARPMGAGRDLFGLRKDGSEVPIEIGLNPIEVKGRTLVLSSIVDITERKRGEQERELLLAREQAARAQAEAASRMKDEFLATVSHELRTPLNAILGWLHIMLGGRADKAAAHRGLETIERNARAQAQLIEDLLDVSRITSGKLRLEAKSTELISVIKAAIDSVQHAADAKEIQLQMILDPGASLIRGDAARLQQVVWNLLSNAVKFTSKGGLVQVRLDRADSMAQITVVDTGEGISPEFLPYVFDRFQQADGTTTRRHGGLGLGLAIARHIVKIHGGTIEAQSAGLGEGANFTVRLPLATARTSGPLPTADRVGVAEEETPDDSGSAILYGLRVLAVDDEPDTRVMLKAMLEQYGADVLAASSAGEAFEALPGFEPDVLVCDIGMPEEDGYSLIRKVRALEPKHGGDTPAIALTGYVRIEQRTRALEAGYQIFVPKPVEANELVSMIASLVGRAERGGVKM